MLLGPMLKLRSAPDDKWSVRVDAILASDEADPRCEGRAPDAVATHPAGFRRLSWELSWARESAPRTARYTLDGQVHELKVPARGHLPRIGFFSCNGFSSAGAARKIEDKFRLWGDLLDESPELLLGGGDQIYGDELFGRAPLQTIEGPRQLVRLARAPARLASAYVDLYVRRWSGTPFARAMARIPGLYTWDDHDIFDGWGSYDEDLQTSPGFRGAFQAAALAFDLIQGGPGRVEGLVERLYAGPQGQGGVEVQARLQAAHLQGEHELLIIAPDLRSCRTREQVFGEAQWAALKALLRRPLTGRRRDVLFISSIPLVYLRFAGVLARIPMELQDDLLDHWEARGHRGEQLRLVQNLLETVEPGRQRVTILSGDVHVGSRGLIEDQRGPERRLIHQLTSSGIVHPPPDAFQVGFMRMVSEEGPRWMDTGVQSRLGEVGDELLLARRNWLSLRFDPPGKEDRLWAQWRTETGPVEPRLIL